METLELNDLYHLNQSIQILYTLRNLDTFGVDALKIVNRLVPSDFPLFNLTNARTCEIEDICLPGAPELTPQIQQAKGLYLGEHPIAQNMHLAINGVYKISDFVSQQELHAREGIYHQFLRLLDTEDQMIMYLPDDSTDSWDRLVKQEIVIAGFILSRSQRSFTERDRLILSLLRPHLFQAYANAQQYQKLQQEFNQHQQSLDNLGVIILDTEGRIISIAPQVVSWLEKYFIKSLYYSKLPDHLWAWVKHQVAILTNQTDPSAGCLPLRIQQMDRELTIRLVIESDRSRYLLLIEEQKLSALDSLRLLGLTQRETQILALLIQGKDNKTIASQVDIKISTVRSHLENIYLKLGVQSRTEAIAHAFQKLGLLHSLSIE